MQVPTLDDIVNLDGRSVDTHFIEGNKPLISRSIYKWPNQLLPSQKAWKCWTKIIREIFNISENNIPFIQNQLYY